MLKLAICDDAPSVVEQLEGFIEKISDISFEYEVFLMQRNCTTTKRVIN